MAIRHSSLGIISSEGSSSSVRESSAIGSLIARKAKSSLTVGLLPHCGSLFPGILFAATKCIAQQEGMPRRRLAEICGENIFGEKATVESPAGAKVTEVVSESLAGASVRHEHAVARHPPSKLVRKESQIRNLCLSDGKHGRAQERASPSVRLHCSM